MKPFREELLPYTEFYEYHYGTKTQYRVTQNWNKVLSNRELLEEIFYPSDPSNLDTDFLMEELGVILGDSLITELTYTRKATHNHLSVVGGIYL